MRRLLALKLKTVKFFGSINETMNEVIQEAAQQPVDINSSHLKISINKVQEHAGTSVFAKLMVLSNELREEYYKIRATHNIQGPESWVGSLSFRVAEGKAAEIQEQIQKMLDESQLAQKFGVSVVTEGPHTVTVGLALP